jgi:hypothetical protein
MVAGKSGLVRQEVFWPKQLLNTTDFSGFCSHENNLNFPYDTLSLNSHMLS